MGQEDSEIPAPTGKSRDNGSTFRTAAASAQGDIVQHPMAPYRLNESFPLDLVDQCFSLILNRTGKPPQWKLHIEHYPRRQPDAFVRTEIRITDVLKIGVCTFPSLESESEADERPRSHVPTTHPTSRSSSRKERPLRASVRMSLTISVRPPSQLRYL